MTRKAFTLIEVIITVTILSILIVYMYQGIDTLKKSNTLLEKKYKQNSYKHKLFKTLFLDASESIETKVLVKDDTCRLLFHTKNSHFGIDEPFVEYLVKNDILYRIESAKAIPQKISYDFLKYVKYEIVKKEVKKFKAFAKGNSVLVVIDDMIFEI